MSNSRLVDLFSSVFPFLKGFIMFHQFIWETIVIHKQVTKGIPRMYNLMNNKALNETKIVIATAGEHDEPEMISRPPVTQDMYNTYKGAAVAYSLFYVASIICAVAFWVTYVMRRRRRRPNFMFLTTGIMVVCNMPAMVSEMFMLKSQGVISWYDDWHDIILQFIYCINAFCNVFMDLFVTNFDKTKDCFGTLIVGAVSFLLMNVFYTPVMWSLVGWYWIGIYEVTSMENVVFVGAAREALNTLILLGHFGQFVSFSLIIIVIVCIVAVRMEKKKKKDPKDEKINPFGIDMRKSSGSTLRSTNDDDKNQPPTDGQQPSPPSSDLVDWDTVKLQMARMRNEQMEPAIKPDEVVPVCDAPSVDAPPKSPVIDGTTAQEPGVVPWESIKMEMERKKMVQGDASPLPPPKTPVATPDAPASDGPVAPDWQTIKLEMERKEQARKSPLVSQALTKPPPAKPTGVAAPITLTCEQDIELWQSIKVEMERRKAAQAGQLMTDPGPMKSDPLTKPDTTSADAEQGNEEPQGEAPKSIKQGMKEKKDETEPSNQELESLQSMKLAKENNQAPTTNNLADHHIP